MFAAQLVRTRRKLIRLAFLIVPGGLACSCMTDFRDSVVTGGLDFVSGSVTSILGSVFPFADLLAGWVGTILAGGEGA